MSGTNTGLRGKCREMAEAAVAADGTLALVRGWYHDPDWGSQEHWWTVKPDGTILDPTAGQFPHGGIAFLYEEFDGRLSCETCGRELTEDSAQWAGRFPVCSMECYGTLVGF